MTDQDMDRSKSEALTRLRRVEGQLRGIQRMIEEDRPCEAVAIQLMAARAALDRASLQIMTHHIESCLTSRTGEPDRANLDRVIAFFLRIAGSASATSVPDEGSTDREAPSSTGEG